MSDREQEMRRSKRLASCCPGGAARTDAPRPDGRACGAAGSIAALATAPAAAAECRADQEDDGTLDSHPFYGKRQAGVVTPQPAAALVAAFDVLADDRAGLEKMLRVLTARIAFLTTGGPAPVLDPLLPPAEFGPARAANLS